METFEELRARIEQRRARARENKRKGLRLFLDQLQKFRDEKQRAVNRRRHEIVKLVDQQHNDKLAVRELSRQISLHEREYAEMRKENA